MGRILPISKLCEVIIMGALNVVNEWKRLRELYPAIEKDKKDEPDRKSNERRAQIRRQGDKKSK